MIGSALDDGKRRFPTSKLSCQSNPKLEEVRCFAGVSQVNANAAGVDIGAHEIMVCVRGPDGQQIVRAFGTYTVDLQAIGVWLRSHGVTAVAMESTGVYWIALFEELERGGFHAHLISARSLRRVPGRKSDVVDCQWVQTLHTYGLLESSFRPEADLVALRTLLRHRTQLIQHRAPHILHMQKALLQMNLQLSQVLSDVTGVTGQAILRAIVQGERDPYKLARMRNYRCKKDEAEIAKALTGTDMGKFPNEKHFSSWLGLAPKHEISGGKVLKSRTLKTRNRAGQAFRMAAGSVMRADCAFGAFYRRQKARLGPAQAAVATAHLIARIVYRMLKYKVEYEPLSVVEYEQRYREQQIKYLQKKAAKLGFQLAPT